MQIDVVVVVFIIIIIIIIFVISLDYKLLKKNSP